MQPAPTPPDRSGFFPDLCDLFCKVSGNRKRALDTVGFFGPVAAHDDFIVFDLGHAPLIVQKFNQSLGGCEFVIVEQQRRALGPAIQFRNPCLFTHGLDPHDQQQCVHLAR